MNEYSQGINKNSENSQESGNIPQEQYLHSDTPNHFSPGIPISKQYSPDTTSEQRISNSLKQKKMR